MKAIIPLLIAAGAGVAAAQPREAGANAIDVSSQAFPANAPIPGEYTCDGEEAAPQLAWTPPPNGTRSVAVLVDDPDAPRGVFTHWLVTGIASSTTELPRGGALPDGAVAAANGKGKHGYAGPCPPTGMHHYHFRVYALDLALPRTMTASQFRSAIQGHVLAQGELIGTYERK